jgi:hypothetical protein
MKQHRRHTAGYLSKKAKEDSTNYNLIEIGHAIVDGIHEELRKCREIYNLKFNEDEYCLVRQCANDCLITNVKRYKYFGYLYLPSPRPDQTVFLYNKPLDIITKRLWTLPSAARMAQLAVTTSPVPENYQEMQAWSIAFFKGKFWEFIRWQHKIDMLSESEYLTQHRDELIKAGCKLPYSPFSEPFDFSKIGIKQVVDTQETILT